MINFNILGASCSKIEPFRFRIMVLYKSTWEAGVSDNIQGILIYKLCNFIYKYLVAPSSSSIPQCCCDITKKYYFSDTRPLYSNSLVEKFILIFLYSYNFSIHRIKLSACGKYIHFCHTTVYYNFIVWTRRTEKKILLYLIEKI